MREVTLLDDTRLYVHDAGEALSDAIIRDSDYFEKEVLEYMSDKHPQQEIIIDIGANIGNHSVYFAQYLEYLEILAFEPIPQNYIILKKNLENFPNTFTYDFALGDSTRPVYMNIKRDNMGACEIGPTGDISVEQFTLDNLTIGLNVTLLKIDVEWYEPQVLAGGKWLIKEHRPLILIEDANRGYGKLLSNYTLEKEWPDHKTYLYRSIYA